MKKKDAMMTKQRGINLFGESWEVLCNLVPTAPRIQHMPYLYLRSIRQDLGRKGKYSTKEEALNKAREYQSVNVKEVLKFIDDKVANTEKFFERIKIIKTSPSREQLLTVRDAYLNIIAAYDSIKVDELPDDLDILAVPEIGSKFYIFNISRNMDALRDSIGFKEFEISGYSLECGYAFDGDRFSSPYAIRYNLKGKNGTESFVVTSRSRSMNSYDCRSRYCQSKGEALQYLEDFERDIAAIKALL